MGPRQSRGHRHRRRRRRRQAHQHLRVHLHLRVSRQRQAGVLARRQVAGAIQSSAGVRHRVERQQHQHHRQRLVGQVVVVPAVVVLVAVEAVDLVEAVVAVVLQDASAHQKKTTKNSKNASTLMRLPSMRRSAVGSSMLRRSLRTVGLRPSPVMTTAPSGLPTSSASEVSYFSFVLPNSSTPSTLPESVR